MVSPQTARALMGFSIKPLLLRAWRQKEHDSSREPSSLTKIHCSPKIAILDHRALLNCSYKTSSRPPTSVPATLARCRLGASRGFWPARRSPSVRLATIQISGHLLFFRAKRSAGRARLPITTPMRLTLRVGRTDISRQTVRAAARTYRSAQHLPGCNSRRSAAARLRGGPR